MLWLWIIACVIVIAALLFIYGYNKIISLEKRVEQSWADIDVQLTRVNELFPNLINTVKSSAVFEKSVLENIAKAHNELIKTMSSSRSIDEKVKAASKFMGVFVPIVYQIPQYPKLTSTKSFKELMDKISVAIDKIAYARQFYNQAVRDYNTFILSAPWFLIGRMIGKKEKSFFEMPERRREEVERRLEKGEYTKGLEKI